MSGGKGARTGRGLVGEWRSDGSPRRGRAECDGGRRRVEAGVSAGDLGEEGMWVAEAVGDGCGNRPRLWFGDHVVSQGVEGAVGM